MKISEVVTVDPLYGLAGSVSVHVPNCPHTLWSPYKVLLHTPHAYDPSGFGYALRFDPSQYFRHGPPFLDVYPGGHAMHILLNLYVPSLHTDVQTPVTASAT